MFKWFGFYEMPQTLLRPQGMSPPLIVSQADWTTYFLHYKE